jgi:hypothetical protein
MVSTKPPRPSHPSRSARRRYLLGSPAFIALRAIRWSLADAGLPASAEHTPAEEARIVTFFALQEILRVLEEFSLARMRGERCHLVVHAHRAERSRVVIDLRIEPESPDGAGRERQTYVKALVGSP